MQLARSGPVPIIGDRTVKTNPIHDVDLAAVCVDAIEGAGPEVLAGGPKVLTRRRITEIALEALGRPLKVRRIPPGLVRFLVPLVKPFNPRVADITAFMPRFQYVISWCHLGALGRCHTIFTRWRPPTSNELEPHGLGDSSRSWVAANWEYQTLCHASISLSSRTSPGFPACCATT